jgi:alkanesulfonate monooxygenase SsuD/methylene tetrahydromethanopterin reductase-like flavin-dependent oxidoreductase (luciferase family)
MILDIFAELQHPAPRRHGTERRIYLDAIEQARLADELGFGCWWAVEHHGSPQFSYSSAPDLMLAVISQHTERIRLGHSGVLGPFDINHPMRIAERAAFLDNVSRGRLELGIARSVPFEWETFGVDPGVTREQVAEALRIIPRMWREGPFRYDGKHLQIPEREVVPKPLQQPHPPLWVTAATPEGLENAGRLGVGVFAMIMFSPIETIGDYVAYYRAGLAHCKPVGDFANRQVACASFFHCGETVDEVIASGAGEAALWFMNAQSTVFGVPRLDWLESCRGSIPLYQNSNHTFVAPSDGDGGDLDDPMPVIRLMNRLHAGMEVDPVEVYDALLPIDSVIIGDVETCRRKLARYAELGVDRLMCLMQLGYLSHERVMQSIRTAGTSLVPELAATSSTGPRRNGTLAP